MELPVRPTKELPLDTLSEFCPDWGQAGSEVELDVEAATTPAVPSFLQQAPALCRTLKPKVFSPETADFELGCLGGKNLLALASDPAGAAVALHHGGEAVGVPVARYAQEAQAVAGSVRPHGHPGGGQGGHAAFHGGRDPARRAWGSCTNAAAGATQARQRGSQVSRLEPAGRRGGAEKHGGPPNPRCNSPPSRKRFPRAQEGSHRRLQSGGGLR